MKLYTIKDVAEMLNVSPKTVYRLINRGRIQMIKIGRSSRIVEESLKQYIAMQIKNSGVHA